MTASIRFRPAKAGPTECATERNGIDATLEQCLDELLSGLRVRYAKRWDEGGWLSYRLAVREGVDLVLSFDLYAEPIDQLTVEFNGEYALHELSQFEARGRHDPRSRERWRQHCLDEVRSIVSSDLRVDIRWLLGRRLGGYLFRREGDRWINCGGGGSLAGCLGLGRRRSKTYEDWRAR